MRLSKLGEFGFIERIRKYIKTDRTVVKGIGDDAAVLKYTKDKYLLFASDMLIEGVHFTLKDATPFQIGHKALACNISDIAAMGGIPHFATVSVGLSESLSVAFVDRLYEGILGLAKKFKVNIVGGDTSRSQKLVIDIAIIGEVKKEYLKLRSGARLNDAILVTGELGGSLKSKKHLNFTPRLKEAQVLLKNHRINSMIDISDGLSADLNHILEDSSAGAILYEERIPISRYAGSFKDALTDGEDFELLFTMPPREAALLTKNPSDGLGIPVSCIGKIVDKHSGMRLMDRHGKRHRLKAQGFRHF